MAGNNSIQILRGNNVKTNTTIKDQILLDGQPLYDRSTGYLFVGGGNTIANTTAVNAHYANSAGTASSATIANTRQKLYFNGNGTNVSWNGSSVDTIYVPTSVGSLGQVWGITSSGTVGWVAQTEIPGTIEHANTAGQANALGSPTYGNLISYTATSDSNVDLNISTSGNISTTSTNINLSANTNININATNTVDIFGNSGLNIKSNGVVNIATTWEGQEIRLSSAEEIGLYSTSAIQLNTVGSTANFTFDGCFHLYTNQSYTATDNLQFKISACTPTTNIAYKIDKIVLGRAGTNYTINFPNASGTVAMQNDIPISFIPVVNNSVSTFLYRGSDTTYVKKNDGALDFHLMPSIWGLANFNDPNLWYVDMMLEMYLTNAMGSFEPNKYDASYYYSWSSGKIPFRYYFMNRSTQFVPLEYSCDDYRSNDTNPLRYNNSYSLQKMFSLSCTGSYIRIHPSITNARLPSSVIEDILLIEATPASNCRLEFDMIGPIVKFTQNNLYAN